MDRSTILEHEGETNRVFKQYLLVARAAGAYKPPAGGFAKPASPVTASPVNPTQVAPTPVTAASVKPTPVTAGED
ncbi:MAG: hypothetical protein U1F35_22735 [Steroidobacteraceae bacterium]